MRKTLLALLFLLPLPACDEAPKEKAETPPAEVAPPAAPDCICAEPTPEPSPTRQLTAARFAELPGWGEDDLAGFSDALSRSCHALMKQEDTAPVGPQGLAGSVADWRPICGALQSLPSDAEVLRAFLESWFRPFLVSDQGKAEGLFTGYYEAEVRGSLTRSDAFPWPLYAPPDDLIRVKLGAFRADLEGQTLFGRVAGSDLVPYYSREEIDGQHKLSGRGLEVIWLADYVELFFLQIQGSGQVVLPDGQRQRVGFAASNGQPFTAIGKLLKESGQLPPDQLSAQGVMAWLSTHPAEAWALMKQNKRYIFFRLIEGDGPIGSQGVALTAGRSLAVDPSFLPLGAPLWLSTSWPGSDQPLNRLLVAQDTGAAITGVVRGDLFWGSGAEALAQAGHMKQQGRYWLLLPASVAERLAP